MAVEVQRRLRVAGLPEGNAAVEVGEVSVVLLDKPCDKQVVLVVKQRVLPSSVLDDV